MRQGNLGMEGEIQNDINIEQISATDQSQTSLFSGLFLNKFIKIKYNSCFTLRARASGQSEKSLRYTHPNFQNSVKNPP